MGNRSMVVQEVFLLVKLSHYLFLGFGNKTTEVLVMDVKGSLLLCVRHFSK